MTDRMMIGRAGEAIALEYLKRKGLKLVARNVYLDGGEIDLVMESDRYCHIVEVKTMTGNAVMMPFEKVNRDKIIHLVKATRKIIYLYKIEKEIVFDIVSILIEQNRVWINYLQDAFSPNR